MKNSWLFILVFMVLGIEVILLYGAKNIVDKADEDNTYIQQVVTQPILSAPTIKADVSAPKQSLADGTVAPGTNEIHFDSVMPYLEPDVPDILNPKMFFLKSSPDFKIQVKQSPASKNTGGEYPSRGDRRDRTYHNYLAESRVERK